MEEYLDCKGCFQYGTLPCSYTAFYPDYYGLCPCRKCLIKPICNTRMCDARFDVIKESQSLNAKRKIEKTIEKEKLKMVKVQ